MPSPFSVSLATLYNGISNQSPEHRLPSQLEDQLNFQSSVVDGLKRRPGTEFVKLLSASNADADSLMHRIYRDTAEQYFVVFTPDATDPIEVYDLDGESYPVLYTGTAKTYVTSTSPYAELRATTIADYTFIANNTVTCAMAADQDTAADPFALLWVKYGLPNGTYQVRADSTDCTGDSTNGYTSEIASDLVTAIDAITDFSASKVPTGIAESSVLRVDKGGAAFTIVASDPYGESGIVLAKGTAKSLNELPPHAADGDLLQIRPSQTSPASIYMKYSLANRRWEEGRAAEVPYAFDATTMPHQMVRLQDDVSGTATGTPNAIYFQVSVATWDDREVGDADSAPTPSFIGRKVRDLVWFRGRLGIIAGDSVCLSRAGESFNFWPSSASDVIDSDPIDEPAGGNEVVALHYALPYGDALLLFGDFQQFSLHSGGDILSPSTVRIEPTTNIQINSGCRPVPGGPNAYFSADAGSRYSQVREYFIEPDTLLNDASDVTSHVPRLIPAAIRSLNPAQNLDMIYASTPSTDMYVYKYLWNGAEKIQSSWSKWTFRDTVLGSLLFDSSLYMLCLAASGEIRMEVLHPTASHETDLGFRLSLDSLATPTAISISGGWINLTFPYAVSASMVLTDTTTGLVAEGLEVVSTYVIRVPETESLPTAVDTYLGGFPFTSRATLSRQVYRPAPQEVLITKRPHITGVYVSVQDSGPYELVEYTSRGSTTFPADPTTIAFVSLDSASLGSDTAVFRTGLDARVGSLTVQSDSHLPLTITAIHLEGSLT